MTGLAAKDLDGAPGLEAVSLAQYEIEAREVARDDVLKRDASRVSATYASLEDEATA